MKIKFMLALMLLLLERGYSQSLPALLRSAEENYPGLKAKAYDVQASREKVMDVKSAIIPSLDAAYQLNYATYNNITGMASGQYFVPISGPPSAENLYDPVVGSAGSLLLNWEPITFGQRASRVRLANAYVDFEEASQAQEILSHQVKVANAYLDVLMSHELIKVHQKNLARAEGNLRIVRSLTASGLRPGVDTALFRAEVSRARIDLLTHRKLLQTQQVMLLELLAVPEVTYDLDSTFFKALPAATDDTTFSNHPIVRVSTARLQVDYNENKVLRRSLNPKLSLWGTAYGRGSGVRYDGDINSTDGLSFTRYNYGVGVNLSVPILKFAHVRHELRSQTSAIHAREERLNLIKKELENQVTIADLTLNSALQIAKENPAFYESALFSYRGLQSRYNSGLVNYVDLVQSQYTLLKAETDLRRSYLESWKALLYKAAVQGDLTIFTNELTNVKR